VTPVDAAHEVLEIQRRAAEGRNRLATLYHQLEQIAVWDNLHLEHVEQLRRAGIELQFFAMPGDAVGEVEAECVQVVAQLPGRKVLVAVAARAGKGEVKVPDEAVREPLPTRDAPSIRAEAAEIDVALHADAKRLHELAALAPAMETERVRLAEQAKFSMAQRSAIADEHLFALQGWVPAETASTLAESLAAEGIPVAVEVLEAGPDEQPPTLVRPPAWARPIEGLFQMLGTIPGYREFDVSIPFMIALPIFTAILIGDGGYGAILLLGPLLAYRRMSKMIGAQFTQLLMLVGGVTLAWGFITSTFFGVSLYRPLIAVDLTDESREFMMWLSFTMGAVHLSIAQLWQAVRFFPNLHALNRVGWALFIWGMYGVIRFFVLNDPMGWNTPWYYLLISGATLAIVFASPSWNIAKMLGMGVAQFPLSMLSAFSDVISYVRLMAVGLASGVLAQSFNDMAFSLSFWPLIVAILVFGHALNLGLALIAMFAHGVRLNMLEFSSNLGVQWTGYAYRPFTQNTIQEYSQ
jgi:V/A-type H+/Na+-transporting ATPase subunit I